MKIRGLLQSLTLAPAAALAVHAPSAFAATAGGGGGFPWDTGFQNFTQDLTGPVAGSISLAAFFTAGYLAWRHGGEMNHTIHGLFGVSFIAFIVCMAQLVMTGFGIQAALL